jgi:hypothetical protein
MLHAWIAVHGFVSLEAFGHLEWMPPPARDALFAAQLQVCLVGLGLSPWQQTHSAEAPG